MKALLIKTDGSREIVNPDGYDQISEAVGGFIEFVQLDGTPGDLIINEEGKLINLDPNPLATAMVVGNLFRGDFIAGDVLVVGSTDPEGETTDVTDEAVVLAEACAAAAEPGAVIF